MTCPNCEKYREALERIAEMTCYDDDCATEDGDDNHAASCGIAIARAALGSTPAKEPGWCRNCGHTHPCGCGDRYIDSRAPAKADESLCPHLNYGTCDKCLEGP